MKFKRITVDPQQMGGVPCTRRLRIPVATVVGMVADGMTRDEILTAYPDLRRKDIDEALRYAAEAVRERELPLHALSEESAMVRIDGLWVHRGRTTSDADCKRTVRDIRDERIPAVRGSR